MNMNSKKLPMIRLIPRESLFRYVSFDINSALRYSNELSTPDFSLVGEGTSRFDAVDESGNTYTKDLRSLISTNSLLYTTNNDSEYLLAPLDNVFSEQKELSTLNDRYQDIPLQKIVLYDFTLSGLATEGFGRFIDLGKNGSFSKDVLYGSFNRSLKNKETPISGMYLYDNKPIGFHLG